MKLIAIETSTDICSIAYIHNGMCKNIIEGTIPRQHAEKLPLFYDELVKLTGLRLSEIDAIAVSIGPGSFTGLRIGLSYAKGLAYSHKKPIVPVPTMQSLLHGSGIEVGNVAVVMRSHGDKYFVWNQVSGIIVPGSGGSSSKYSRIHVLTCESVNDLGIDLPNTKIIYWNCEKLFGEVEKMQNVMPVKPSAKWIGELAYQNYNKWVVKKPYKLVPDYVSPFKIGNLKSES